MPSCRGVNACLLGLASGIAAPLPAVCWSRRVGRDVLVEIQRLTELASVGLILVVPRSGMIRGTECRLGVVGASMFPPAHRPVTRRPETNSCES